MRLRGADLALRALLLLLVVFFATGLNAHAARAKAQARPTPAITWRIGLQVGHLHIEDLPDDQARLRGQSGGSGGGYREVDINYTIAQLTTALLMQQGITVDLLPATVPKGYRADAFIAIHCDASGDQRITGYKLARYRASLIPQHDDALIASISTAYGLATGLPLDTNITRGMTGYYAYNTGRYQSTIDPYTPSAIIELGFLTNPADRALLVGRQELVTAALAAGILHFLTTAPPSATRAEDRLAARNNARLMP